VCSSSDTCLRSAAFDRFCVDNSFLSSADRIFSNFKLMKTSFDAARSRASQRSTTKRLLRSQLALHLPPPTAMSYCVQQLVSAQLDNLLGLRDHVQVEQLYTFGPKVLGDVRHSTELHTSMSRRVHTASHLSCGRVSSAMHKMRTLRDCTFYRELR
jgi:hypothetical protein